MTRYWTGLRSWNSSTSRRCHRVANLVRRGRVLEQLGRLDDERVEVDDVSLGEELLVPREESCVVRIELIAAKPVHGEPRQHLAMRLLAAPSSRRSTVRWYSSSAMPNPAARLHVRAVLAQQLGAERVDRAALDALRARAELARETRRDLVGGLVRERERADARRVEPSCSMRKRMRSMRQNVLPAPGPARTRVGPGGASMAARWDGDGIVRARALDVSGARATRRRPRAESSDVSELGSDSIFIIPTRRGAFQRARSGRANAPPRARTNENRV